MIYLFVFLHQFTDSSMHFIMHFIASSLQCIKHFTLYAGLPGFASHYIVTGDHLCPDMLLSIDTDALYITELTAVFEANIDHNSERKHNKCRQPTHDLSSIYRCVN